MPPGASSGPIRVAVVIPALNEERSLPLVLEGLTRAGGGLGHGLGGRPVELSSVVVVDNGSTDRTAAVASAAGARVVREPRRGYGSACLAGMAFLAGHPPDIVAFLDADFSDDPARLPTLVGPIADGSVDFVLGSRLMGESEPGALLPQARYGNALAVWLLRLLYGCRYTDLGPFRALTWEALQRLRMRDESFGWTVEMQLKAARAGLRVREVSVPYRRRVGSSKITGTLSGTMKAGAKILWTIARYRFAGDRISRDRGSS